MSTPNKTSNANNAWDNGALGNEEKFVGHLPEEELRQEEKIINESLDLRPISIRLEKTLVESFKAIATINGLRYQTLMRQALKRFADAEMKKIATDVAAEIRSKQVLKSRKSA